MFIDAQAPTAVVSINGVSINGAAANVTSLIANLTVTASDVSAVTGMCIANSAAGILASCSDWQAFNNAVAWQLAPGPDGPREVSVWLRDEFNNTMALPARATIVVDVNPPSNASVVIARGAAVIADYRNVRVDFGAWDYSGVAQMCYDQGGSDGSACQGSWVAYQPVVVLTFSSDQVGTQHGS